MNLEQCFKAWGGLPPDLSLDAYRFIPYEQGGVVRAIAALDGTEIHFAVHPAYRHRVITRHRTRAFLAPLLEECGFLTTRALPGHRAFLTRLGFRFTWNNGRFDHFMLSALPWAPEN